MNASTEPFYIFVDSDERTSGSNTNFEVEFSNMTAVIGKECRVQLVSAEVCLGSIYQITSGNNTFCFSVDGTSTISFDIVPGTYTVTSITSYLKTQMESLDLVSNTYTFSYNQDTNKISIVPTYASGTFELRCNLNSSDINAILGLGNDLVTVLSGNEYIFPLQTDMFPYYNFYLCCDSVYTRNLGSGSRNYENALVKMSLNHRFTRNLFKYEDYDTYNCFIRQFPSRMRFYIISDTGRLPELPSNLKTTLTLKIFPMR
ncbi:MAG: hypothetical protein IM318_19415 [Microcystis sp. M017S1]|uniref:hypothetical protein n=1 Tax=Microcystis sp. M017S1 TaxID=2771107 RepID=UPI0025826D37|nr:hypothetical protein [Microcystis sp. M017S1]MCA2919742.1 hypothetical protein [Microcystis sp. M017S1]